jgi:putative SOS response-associated peptidase YedK
MVPFSFAGLWVDNSDLNITSCTILTAVAQEPMRQLHDRQEIIQPIG